MRHSRYLIDSRAKDSRAAIFVDYDNLHRIIGQRLGQHSYADEYIAEMLDELRQYLQDEEHITPSVAMAFSDFGALSGNGSFIQRSLYLQGFEPRFVPSSLQANAVEIQFCADVSEVLHRRSDIQMFVLLTGNRAYMPLVQQIKRYGRTPIVASLEWAPASETMQFAEGDFRLDAHYLLSEATRRDLLAGAPAGSTRIDTTAAEPRDPADFVAVTDPIQLNTLDIIESYFGQYEEVYLTPLLRKLSELLDERDHDPKSIISTLEEHGAVRLEKRRGFPHDYTVLIVESEHPDVQTVRENVNERNIGDDGDDYGDDYYDDYDADLDYREDDIEANDLPRTRELNEENFDEETL